MECQVHHPLVCRYGNLARSIRSRSVPLVGPAWEVRVSALPVRNRAQPCPPVLSSLLTPGLWGVGGTVGIRTGSWLKTVVRRLADASTGGRTPLVEASAPLHSRPGTPRSAPSVSHASGTGPRACAPGPAPPRVVRGPPPRGRRRSAAGPCGRARPALAEPADGARPDASGGTARLTGSGDLRCGAGAVGITPDGQPPQRRRRSRGPPGVRTGAGRGIAIRATLRHAPGNACGPGPSCAGARWPVGVLGSGGVAPYSWGIGLER